MEFSTPKADSPSAETDEFLHQEPSLPMRLLIHSGDSVLLFPISALLAWLGPSALQAVSRMSLLAMVVSGSVGWIVKQAIRKPRPSGSYGKGYRRYDPYAFPSGHAARSFSLAAVVMLNQPLLPGILILAWATATSFIRVRYGLHHASDILGGIALGLATSATLQWLGILTF